ncbi:MAG: hypothetical protein QM775_12330 [Pirellulales bacterium]
MIAKNFQWRLSVPILIVGTLILVLGAVAAVYVHREYQQRAEYVRRQFAGLNALQNLFVAERDVRYFLREFLLRGDATQIEEARQLRHRLGSLCRRGRNRWRSRRPVAT